MFKKKKMSSSSSSSSSSSLHSSLSASFTRFRLPFASNTHTKQTTLSSWVTLSSPLEAIVEIIELNGSSLVLTYKGTAPIPFFSEIINHYFIKTGMKNDSREFRTISEVKGHCQDRIVQIKLNVRPPKGKRTLIYAFLPEPPRFPDFIQDIVPRLIDAGYAPDIACLLNVSASTRVCPLKSNGYSNFMHDISYRAWKDSKWKNGSDSKLVRKDNWLHLRYIAAYKAKNKKKLRFFHDHNIAPLSCCSCGDADISNVLHCKCGRMTLCIDCDVDNNADDWITCSQCKMHTCSQSRCKGRFCESGVARQSCVGFICDECERKQPFTFCESVCQPCRLINPANFSECLTCSMYKCINCIKYKCEWNTCTAGLCKECYSAGVNRSTLRHNFGWKVTTRILPTDVHLVLCAPHVIAQRLAIQAATEAARLAVIATAETARLAAEAARLADIARSETERLAAVASAAAFARQIAKAPAVAIRTAALAFLESNSELLEDEEEEGVLQEEVTYVYSPE